MVWLGVRVCGDYVGAWVWQGKVCGVNECSVTPVQSPCFPLHSVSGGRPFTDLCLSTDLY